MSRVVSFHYVLRNDQNVVIDSSTVEEGPLTFLEGTKQIIPALEAELKLMSKGDKKSVSLKAQDAYGLIDPKMVMNVPRTEMAHLTIEVGSFMQLDLGDQMKVVKITAATPDVVTLDGNHPLAGQDLNFEIELVDFREATEEEMAHKHVHGPGGHHH